MDVCWFVDFTCAEESFAFASPPPRASPHPETLWPLAAAVETQVASRRPLMGSLREQAGIDTSIPSKSLLAFVKLRKKVKPLCPSQPPQQRWAEQYYTVLAAYHLFSIRGRRLALVGQFWTRTSVCARKQVFRRFRKLFPSLQTTVSAYQSQVAYIAAAVRCFVRHSWLQSIRLKSTKSGFTQKVNLKRLNIRQTKFWFPITFVNINPLFCQQSFS